MRLVLALAVSVGLHAAALGIYRPSGTAAPSGALPQVLHAFLAPAEHAPAETPMPEMDKPGGAGSGLGGSGAAAGMPAPDRWFKRSELDTIAAPVTAVKLDYPETAKSRGAAQVQVRLFIDERGVVRKVTIETSGPERAFEDAAVRAWDGVRFSPAVRNGVAVKSQQVIEVDFHPEVAFR